MRYFPVNLDIYGKRGVVIGGGVVATRKCLLLVDAGAAVTVISPEVTPELGEMASTPLVSHLPRSYRAGDLAGFFLVFAATNDPLVNSAVADEARRCGILADIVDAPGGGTFTVPATLCRGDLLIAVSTAGKSPALARRIRQKLENSYGPEYGPLLVILGSVREKLLTRTGESDYNRQILNVLLDHDLPALLRGRATAEIDDLLLRLFGPEYTLAELGLRDEDLS